MEHQPHPCATAWPAGLRLTSATLGLRWGPSPAPSPRCPQAHTHRGTHTSNPGARPARRRRFPGKGLELPAQPPPCTQGHPAHSTAPRKHPPPHRWPPWPEEEAARAQVPSEDRRGLVGGPRGLAVVAAQRCEDDEAWPADAQPDSPDSAERRSLWLPATCACCRKPGPSRRVPPPHTLSLCQGRKEGGQKLAL